MSGTTGTNGTSNAKGPDGRLPELAEAAVWVFDEIAEGRSMPLIEAEAIVNTLFAERKWANQPVFPLLAVDRADVFLPIQALNVAALSMALASTLQFDDAAVRRIGLAAFFHDVGMLRLPADMLNKPGQMGPEDRQRLMRHPVEGARLLIANDPSLDLASVVAYEHHLRMDGSGYPTLLYPRSAHYVSRLVQVCDVFCALSSARSYRAAWPVDIILSFLSERSGFEFHPALAESLGTMVQQAVQASASV